MKTTIVLMLALVLLPLAGLSPASAEPCGAAPDSLRDGGICRALDKEFRTPAEEGGDDEWPIRICSGGACLP